MAPNPPPALPPALEKLVYPGREPLGGLRAALFDVYGTLFISAAGDIAGGETAGGDLDALIAEYVPDCTGEGLRDYFREAVLRRHRESKAAYPEVRVEEIWAGFFRDRRAAGRGAEIDPREFALRYELALNPVYPMPGALETIGALKARGFVLGLVSNAQFFTPLLFEAFFGASPEGLGFDPGLLIYSFEAGEAKPSPALFTRAVRGLESLGIEPGSCLYVGNDMLKDIRPAAAAGFKTVLFAGDGRSLRLRDQGPAPQGIVRSLADLSALIGPPYA
jgi:putative hydrolase of the HAD superfamily